MKGKKTPKKLLLTSPASLKAISEKMSYLQQIKCKKNSGKTGLTPRYVSSVVASDFKYFTIFILSCDILYTKDIILLFDALFLAQLEWLAICDIWLIIKDWLFHSWSSLKPYHACNFWSYKSHFHNVKNNKRNIWHSLQWWHIY